MKIALVIKDLDVSGGSQRQIIELALALQKMKHDVDIVCELVEKSRCHPELISRVSIEQLSHDSSNVLQRKLTPTDGLIAKIFKLVMNNVAQLFRNKSIKRDFVDLLKRKKYDACQFHDNGLVWLSQYSTKISNTWMMNDPHSFIDAYEKKQSTINTNPLLYVFFKIYVLFIRNFISQNISTILVLDERNASIVDKYYGLKAKVVRSGFRKDAKYNKNDILVKQRSSPQQIRILTTNIFFPHRRYEDLVVAARQVVRDNRKKKGFDIEFRICGDQTIDREYFSYINSLVSKYKLDGHIKFLGKITERELRTEYKTAQIFVFPNDHQTWGLSAIEAMYFGCALVVTKGSGVSEILEHSSNAMIASPRSPSELAKYIQELIDNRRLRETLSLNAHDLVKRKFSWERYASDNFEIIKEAA